MPISDDEFHAEFERLTTEMLEIAYDWIEGHPNVDVLYVYGGMTELVNYQAFYRVGKEVATIPDVLPLIGEPRASNEEIRRPVAEGAEVVNEFMHLFADNGKDTPYELRIVYDCKQQSMELALNYDELPEHTSVMARSTKWLWDIEDGKPPLPGC